MNNKFENKEDNLFVLSKRDSIVEDVQGSDLTFFKDALIRFRKNKAAFFSTFVFFFILLLAISAPFLGAYHNKVTQYNGEPEKNMIGAYQDLDYRFLSPRIPLVEKIGIFDGNETYDNLPEDASLGPNPYFLLGTDDQGRDLFVRTMVGALISISFGILAALIDLLLGVSLGAISGYFGGKIDLVLQRIVEIIGSIPSLIWVILIMVAMGPGFIPLILAITISGWIPMYRIVRGQMMKIKNQEYVLSAKTIGQTDKKIIFKHILPNTMSVIIIWIMFTIPNAIFFESFLSFLGLGISSPIPSLGSLAANGKDYLNSNPYILFVPAMTLSFIMLSLNLIADGLRDALDPKLRGGK